MRDHTPQPRKTIAALGVAAALLAGCGSTVDLGRKAAVSPAIHGNTVTVTPAQTGQTITLAFGQQLDVRLPTNPASGFDWQRDGPDTGVLTTLGPPGFQRERLDQNDFENAGFDIWKFKPLAAGQQKLRFEYRRRAQLASEPPEAVWFFVTVR